MPLKIALVNMPFGFHIYPSIQLGTLSTLLKTKGCEVKSHYLNLYFAHQLGLPIYNQLCEKRFLIGEWLFSHTLYGKNPKNLDNALILTEKYFVNQMIENAFDGIKKPETSLRQFKLTDEKSGILLERIG